MHNNQGILVNIGRKTVKTSLFHGIKRQNEKSTFHDMFCKASQYASLIPIKNISILSSGILISSLLGKKRKADLSLKHQLQILLNYGSVQFFHPASCAVVCNRLMVLHQSGSLPKKTMGKRRNWTRFVPSIYTTCCSLFPNRIKLEESTTVFKPWGILGNSLFVGSK